MQWQNHHFIVIFFLIGVISITFAGCKIEPDHPAEVRTFTPPVEEEPADPAQQPPTSVQMTETPLLGSTSTGDEQTPTATSTPGPTPTPYPETWKDWPVVPVVSQNAIDIYQRGIEMGNDPHSFAVIGDCNSQASIFLAPFDQGVYRLGEYEYLQETIDQFEGSFSARRPAAQNGFNGATVLSPFFTDLTLCESNETPLECEFRRKNPSIVLISLGTNWVGSDATNRRDYFEEIVEYSIAEGVVPILGTKADNLEGDHSINQLIVDLAIDYDIPLWNFWQAANQLPGGGLVYAQSGELYNLSYALNYFDDEVGMQAGWPHRNLTALQAIDAVWRAGAGLPQNVSQ